MLVVILPDKNGEYSYYDNLKLFRILEKNINNGLANVVTWDDFTKYPNTSINKAVTNLNNIDEDLIIKSV